ncbi:MAG: STAS/SEC14 domain-containing protein [Myxococcota bacterium]
MELLDDTPLVKRCRFGSVVVSRYRGAVGVEDMDGEYAALRQAAALHGRVSSLALIDADSMTSPSGAVKTRAAELTRALGDARLCGAIVLLGSSVSLRLMTYVLGAFHLLTGAGEKQGLFTDLDEAVRWVRSRPGQDATALALDANELRRTFGLAGS